MPLEINPKSDKRKDWVIVLLAFGNVVAWFLGKFEGKIPSWFSFVAVGGILIYFIWKSTIKNPYPPNAVGAKRASKSYIHDPINGLGISNADFHFWNVEVQEISATSFLVGVRRRDRRKFVLLYRAGQGITSDRKQDIVKVVENMETSDLARKAIQSQGVLSNPFVQKFLQDYGLNQNQNETTD